VRPALSNAIDVVRKRIQQIRDRKEIVGEQNTKAALIDPILTALGWDLQEMDESRREYRRKPQDNPVDYALFLNRTETLFIGAKSLERDLSDRKWISQNLSYATVVGVRWCVLTNGDEYRIYNSHAPVDVEQKLFRSVRISDTANANSAADTLHLLSKDQMQGRLLDELWKAHFIDANVSRSIELLLANEDPGLIRLLCKKTKGVTLKRAKIRIDLPVPLAALSGGARRPVRGSLRTFGRGYSRHFGDRVKWDCASHPNLRVGYLYLSQPNRLGYLTEEREQMWSV
jgi:hypothetical protein